MTKVLLVDDPRFDAHAPRAYHPERPERLGAARRAIAHGPFHPDGAHAKGWELQPVAAREASDEELARVHAEPFLCSLARLEGKMGHLDADTYFAPKSVSAARLAAGGLVALVDRVLDGDGARGIALLRPPGHHATPTRAMGFCLLNNVAVAAAHARARGLSRVLVVDWDVHHGNGTQEMFWRDPSVLYVSTHQFPFYPGTGSAGEVGEGDGTGYTVNVPLRAGSDDATYQAAFERIILPIAEAYAPELVLVSAGFDAAKRDPLAQMELGDGAFGWMGAALARIAEATAGGRMILALEGGYDLPSLERGLSQAVLGMLTGEAPGSSRGPSSSPGGHEGAKVTNEDDVARAQAAAAKFWPVVA